MSNESGKQIVLTIGQLDKILKGTDVGRNHFLAKLANVKADEYKTEQLNKRNKE